MSFALMVILNLAIAQSEDNSSVDINSYSFFSHKVPFEINDAKYSDALNSCFKKGDEQKNVAFFFENSTTPLFRFKFLMKALLEAGWTSPIVISKGSIETMLTIDNLNLVDEKFIANNGKQIWTLKNRKMVLKIDDEFLISLIEPISDDCVDTLSGNKL